MSNILQEMIKILHEKTLNAIYLHWFHNDTSEENNTLNGHSNEAWIMDSGKIFLHLTEAHLRPCRME